MRRVIFAAALVLATAGTTVISAGADTSSGTQISLSYDLSDNSAPAAVAAVNGGNTNAGAFNVIVDVLPEKTPGFVRVVAIAPQDAGVSNMVCRYQAVVKSSVECAFNFTASGTWTIKSQYAVSKNDPVSATAVTNLNVGN